MGEGRDKAREEISGNIVSYSCILVCREWGVLAIGKKNGGPENTGCSRISLLLFKSMAWVLE